MISYSILSRDGDFKFTCILNIDENMSRQDHIEELTPISIDSVNEDFEYDSVEKSIEKILTTWGEVNLTRQRETRRKTFRNLMEVLKDVVNKLERDEALFSLGHTRSLTGHTRESDLRTLHKANLAISDLLEINQTLKRQQRRLKRKLARQGKNNKY